MILNPKLLIVDDERGIVDMIQSYFQTRYDILTAYSEIGRASCRERV